MFCFAYILYNNYFKRMHRRRHVYNNHVDLIAIIICLLVSPGSTRSTRLLPAGVALACPRKCDPSFCHKHFDNLLLCPCCLKSYDQPLGDYVPKNQYYCHFLSKIKAATLCLQGYTCFAAQTGAAGNQSAINGMPVACLDPADFLDCPNTVQSLPPEDCNKCSQSTGNNATCGCGHRQPVLPSKLVYGNCLCDRKCAAANDYITNLTITAPLNPDHDCTGITCPRENLSCPADSILLPGVLHPDQCCPTPSRCQCKANCPPSTCPRATTLTMIRRATHAPGSCCDQFVCTSVQPRSSRTNDSATDRLTCLYDNEEYVDGENWTDGDCIKCQCKSGIAFCSHEQCPRLHCDQPIMKKGTCCPSCDGCVTAAGVTHKESDVWKEDDCVHCSCENGQIRCHIEDCQTTCRSPKKIDGQCCPVCGDDDESFVAFPTNCPQRKCEKLCRHGYVNDSNGCYKCECKVENCTLSCEFGYELDTVSGENICSCLRNTVDSRNNVSSVHCPNTTNCTGSCRLNHTQPDADGCPICVCDRCPEFRIENCPVDCLHGYQHDEKQCLTCKCIENDSISVPTSSSIYIAYTSSEETLPTSSLSPTTTMTSPMPEAALQSILCTNGSDDMLPWTEGCHTCICTNGRKMCDIQFCHIKNPDAAQDGSQECCDRPHGSRSQVFLHSKSFCEAVPDGTSVGDSELPSIKFCGTCICSAGVVYCTDDQCPVELCNGTLTQEDSACCPSCLPASTGNEHSHAATGSTPKAGCTARGQVYQSGTTWWESVCRACQCMDGTVECEDIRCPKLECDVAIKQNGKCCDTCSNTTFEPTCVYGDKIFKNHEHWKPSECSSCVCNAGQVICDELKCLPSCKIDALGSCCSGCKYETKAYPKHANVNINAAPTEATYQADWMFPFFIIVIFLIIIIVVLFLLVKKCRHKRSIQYSRPEVTRLESPDTASSSKTSTLRKPQQSAFFFSRKKNQIPV